MTKMDEEELTAEDIALMEKRAARRAERLALLATLEKRLGIPQGFIDGLLAEPDEWSLVIKLAVLVEASVTHALVLHLKNGELFNHFADLSNNKRLQLAKQFGIIDQLDCEALGELAWMRNRFAHNVRYLDSDLWTFFDAQTPDKKAEVINKMLKRQGKDKAKAVDDFSGFKPMLKLTVYLATITALRSVATHGIEAESEAEKQRWERWTLADMFKGQGAGDDQWWQTGSSPVGSDAPQASPEAADSSKE